MKCPYCGHPDGDKPHIVYRSKGRRKRCRGKQKHEYTPVVETREERWGVVIMPKRRWA